MSHWWRAYDDSVDHPKLCLLSDQAHRGWFNLCCVASANGGALPPMEELEIKLRLPKKKIQAIMTELRARKLLDEIDGVMLPHNWARRQFKTDVTDPTNAERQRRYRHRHGVTAKTVTEGVTGTVTNGVTKGVTDKRPDTEREERKEESKSLSQEVNTLSRVHTLRAGRGE